MVFIDNFTDERFLQKEKLKKNADIILIFCVVGFSLNVVLAFAISIWKLNENFAVYMIAMSAVSVITMLCVSLMFARLFGGMKNCIKKYEKKTGLLDNILLVILGFSGCMTVNFILNFISDFIPLPVGNDIAMPESVDIYSMVFMQLAIAIAPAICEEIAFRGFVMGGLADFGEVFAVLVSSAFFGMMHTGISGILFAFAVGLLLGCIRRVSGSLIPSMIVHFLNNAYSVAILVVFYVFDIEVFADVTNMFIYIMCGVFVVMLFVIRKRNIGFFTFSTGECILTKAEKAKIIFTSPILWVFVIFSAIISILSLAGTAA